MVAVRGKGRSWYCIYRGSFFEFCQHAFGIEVQGVEKSALVELHETTTTATTKKIKIKKKTVIPRKSVL